MRKLASSLSLVVNLSKFNKFDPNLVVNLVNNFGGITFLCTETDTAFTRPPVSFMLVPDIMFF